MTLKCDHFHFSGKLDPDLQLCKEINFDIKKPDKTIILGLHIPFIQDIRIELDFVSFQRDVLSMHILSDRKLVNLLIGFLNHYIREIPYLEINYPDLRINTHLLSRAFFPSVKICNIALDGDQYIIETELN